MKISVITPYYQGEKYMAGYLKCLRHNQNSLEKMDASLEVILVNDSPKDSILLSADKNVSELKINNTSFCKIPQNVVVLANEVNSGIHFSRVQGLKAATGDYVMFLDQDDLLTDDALAKLLTSAKSTLSDVTVCNAMLQQSDASTLLWYRNDYHKALIGNLETYLRVGIQIISPGHTLIKRSAIPEFWMTHIMKQNGADDYFLWLLMLARNARFSYLDEPLYNHSYTGENLSANTSTTDESAYEFMEYLADDEFFKKQDIVTLHEMITYKNQFRQSNGIGKITCSLANLSLFISNLKYKSKTKTSYGFNRG